MRLSAILLAIVPVAFASASHEQQLELQHVFGQIAEFGESLNLPSVGSPNICWNGFSRGNGSVAAVPTAAVCEDGTELFGDRCYVPCAAGYKAWGPFCLSTSKTAPSRSYQRGNGKLVSEQAVFSHVNAAADVDFVANACPPSLPYQCAIACTKNAVVCASEGVSLTTAALKIVQLAQKGDLGNAAVEAKKIYEKVSGWPKCAALNI